MQCTDFRHMGYKLSCCGSLGKNLLFKYGLGHCEECRHLKLLQFLKLNVARYFSIYQSQNFADVINGWFLAKLKLFQPDDTSVSVTIDSHGIVVPLLSSTIYLGGQVAVDMIVDIPCKYFL